MKPTVIDIEGIARRRWHKATVVKYTIVGFSVLVWFLLAFLISALVNNSVSPLIITPISDTVSEETRDTTIILIGMVIGVIPVVGLLIWSVWEDHKKTLYLDKFKQAWVDTKDIPDLMP